MSLRFGHMLGIEPLTAEEIVFLLDQSKPFQEIQRHPSKKLATLRGKTVALAFFEPSTRTRISFATAASRLGADQMNLQAESSSLKKGESLLDTVRTLDAMKPDCIVIRHSSSGAPEVYYAASAASGDQRRRWHAWEHPTQQALLDALTIRDRRGTIEGLNIAQSSETRSCTAEWRARIFTCFRNSVAASLFAAQRCGCRGKSNAWDHRALQFGASLEYRLRHWKMRTSSLPCACSRSGSTSRRSPSTNIFCSTNSRRSACAGQKPDALVLHPGPMIRGLEIDPAVADGPQSCVSSIKSPTDWLFGWRCFS